MRERDTNRKLFHKGHYEIIAKRFREALEPYYSIQTRTDLPTDVLAKKRREALLPIGALVNLALDMALRFQADNSDFEPETFLDRCSPNVDLYPLSELWADFATGKLVEHSTKA